MGYPRKEMMGDIAVLTGGTFIAEDLGRTLESVELEERGRAKKVVITKDNTTIIDGAGKKAEMKSRADQIKAQCRARIGRRDCVALPQSFDAFARGAAGAAGQYSRTRRNEGLTRVPGSLARR